MLLAAFLPQKCIQKQLYQKDTPASPPNISRSRQQHQHIFRAKIEAARR